MRATLLARFALTALVFGGLIGCPGVSLEGALEPSGSDSGSDSVLSPGQTSLEPEGIVGYVRDTAGEPVVGATVFLVPSGDIPTQEITLTDLAVERASTVDEPLEDTIAAKGAEYAQAITDADGEYRITTVAPGSYYLVVMPADAGHLPGGSLCRKALPQAEIVGRQRDIELSAAPSPAAKYVGPSVCINCHGLVHEYETLHYNGLRKIGEHGPLQSNARFPDWDLPLAKFSEAGTTLYYYAYNGNSAAPDWKLSETDPGTGVSFTARLYSSSGKYYVDLTDVKGTSGSVVYEVEMSYGGGLYKQRYVVRIAGSRYILPIQFNFQGQTDETQPSSRWVWQQYNAQNWYDETAKTRKVPGKGKAFDNNCAGCHFTGFSLTGDGTSGYKAHAVPDINGEMDYDGDGLAEAINITCETCHGPGSEHWEQIGRGYSIVSPRLLTPEREVAICAQCHTRALGVGGNATETPMDSNGHMMRAGTSRATFLTSYVSKLDDGLWDTVKGDGKHSKKHHQQASDFIKSGKYRNSYELLTCASCHDPHGKTGLANQLRAPLDSAGSGAGLCLSCHSLTFPEGARFADRVKAHYVSQGLPSVWMEGAGCTECHMPKTAKSGSGLRQGTIERVTYYSGDISSHLFDVPLKSSIATKAADMMPIPLTNACGLCHLEAP